MSEPRPWHRGPAPPPVPRPPAAWHVGLFSVFFNVLGVVLAYSYASYARRLGFSERPYWVTWAAVSGVWLWLLLLWLAVQVV